MAWAGKGSVTEDLDSQAASACGCEGCTALPRGHVPCHPRTALWILEPSNHVLVQQPWLPEPNSCPLASVVEVIPRVSQACALLPPWLFSVSCLELPTCLSQLAWPWAWATLPQLHYVLARRDLTQPCAEPPPLLPWVYVMILLCLQWGLKQSS